MPTARKDDQISLRLPSELKERMVAYAHLTGRSNNYVAMEAVSEYLTWRSPQTEDLRAAIREADAGGVRKRRRGARRVRALRADYAASSRHRQGRYWQGGFASASLVTLELRWSRTRAR